MEECGYFEQELWFTCVKWDLTWICWYDHWILGFFGGIGEKKIICALSFCVLTEIPCNKREINREKINSFKNTYATCRQEMLPNQAWVCLPDPQSSRSTGTRLRWRKVQHLLQSTKQEKWVANAENQNSPNGFQGRVFKGNIWVSRVCDFF